MEIPISLICVLQDWRVSFLFLFSLDIKKNRFFHMSKNTAHNNIIEVTIVMITTTTTNPPPNYCIETTSGEPLPHNGNIVIWTWILRKVNSVFVAGQWWDISGAHQVDCIKRYGPNHGRCKIKYYDHVEIHAYWRKKNVSPKSLKWLATSKIGAPTKSLLDIHDFATTGTHTEDVIWGDDSDNEYDGDEDNDDGDGNDSDDDGHSNDSDGEDDGNDVDDDAEPADDDDDDDNNDDDRNESDDNDEDEDDDSEEIDITTFSFGYVSNNDWDYGDSHSSDLRAMDAAEDDNAAEDDMSDNRNTDD